MEDLLKQLKIALKESKDKETLTLIYDIDDFLSSSEGWGSWNYNSLNSSCGCGESPCICQSSDYC